MTEIKPGTMLPIERPGTPLPWSLPHFAEEGSRCGCGYVFSDAQEGMGAIATFHRQGDEIPLRREATDLDQHEEPDAKAVLNARYAITAINTYPSLIAGLREAREALAESREALHFHYVEWDGEPEDAVPLQLARSQCDAALAKLDTLLSQEGQP